MRIRIKSIEASLLDLSTMDEEKVVIKGWWIKYQVTSIDPQQEIEATLFWEYFPDENLIMKHLKQMWEGCKL